MPTNYRASLNIDFTNQQNNEYQKLVHALVQAGWSYVETSALIIESTELGRIWRGIELVAKQCSDAGDLSALTFHIQGSNNFSGVPYAGARNFPHAEDEILAKPYPR